MFDRFLQVRRDIPYCMRSVLVGPVAGVGGADRLMFVACAIAMGAAWRSERLGRVLYSHSGQQGKAVRSRPQLRCGIA